MTALDRLVAHAQAVQASWPGTRVTCCIHWAGGYWATISVQTGPTGRNVIILEQKSAWAVDLEDKSADAVVSRVIELLPVRPFAAPCQADGPLHVEMTCGPADLEAVDPNGAVAARCEVRP
jgi:hypothetical protein